MFCMAIVPGSGAASLAWGNPEYRVPIYGDGISIFVVDDAGATRPCIGDSSLVLTFCLLKDMRCLCLVEGGLFH
jgi:hypothetical protein